jgi:hypothetical protein
MTSRLEKLGLAWVLIGIVCKPSNLGGDKMVAVNTGCKPAWEICTDIQRSGLQLVNAWECPIGRAGCGLPLANAGCGQLLIGHEGCGLQLINSGCGLQNWSMMGLDSNWSMLGADSY